MSGSAGRNDDGGPPPGRRPLGAVIGVVDRVTSVMNAAGTVWILALMLLINADVIGRGVLGRPINGVPEMVSLSIVGIVFLQLANTLRVGRLTRSETMLTAIARRWPRIAAVMDALFNLIGAAVMAVMVHAAFPIFLRAWQRGEFVGAVGNFTAPVWPIDLILLVGAAALGVTFLLNAAIAAAAAGRAGRR
ncbi:MAG: TRAP transporter small permease subunit [Inquilinaceae bacterium]